MAEVAADRSGVGHHRDGGEAESRKGAQIGHEHAIVGMARALEVEIERIGVLHQEFARPHHAEARPHLVPELPLDVIEVERQVLVGAHRGPEDLRDHLLVGWAVQHVALVPVLDAQHLLAVVVVAAGLAPKIGRLDGRHLDLDGAGAVLLLAHDRIDLVEHPQPERQPGVDTGRFLPDHAGAEHQPMRHDLGLLRRLAQDGQEISAETHRRGLGGEVRKGKEVAPQARRQTIARPRKTQGWRGVRTRGDPRPLAQFRLALDRLPCRGKSPASRFRRLPPTLLGSARRNRRDFDPRWPAGGPPSGPGNS